MNMKNSQIRAYARHLLDDNIFGKDWLKGVFVFLLMNVTAYLLGWALEMLLELAILGGALLGIVTNSIPVILFLLIWLVYIAMIIGTGLFAPINVGVASVYTDLVRNGEKIKIRNFFCGFKNFFSNVILGVMYSLIIGLWSMFFIVPGVYVAYSYALVFHVKKDHPEYRWKQCFDESERLMEGNRWKLFKLQISHLGWFILGFAFLFIGVLWAYPYLETSMAIFYEEVRTERQ